MAWLFFDAAFTLIHPHPTVGTVYARHAARHGVAADPAALDHAFRLAWKTARAGAGPLPHGRTLEEARRFWYRVIRDTFAGAGLEAPGAPTFLADLFDDFATASCWRLDAEAESAIALARERGLRVGVLSNFDARLRPVLQDLRIADRLDLIVASADAGFEKPDPRLFHHAAALTGSAGPFAHIGDEPEADGHGPRAAGWHQCLALRPGAPAPDGLIARTGLLAATRAVLDSMTR